MGVIVPELGLLQPDVHFPDLLASEPVPVALLRGARCRFVFDDYTSDPHREDFHDAVAAFLGAGPEVLDMAQDHVLQYCNDEHALSEPGTPEHVQLNSATRVWNHVRFGADVQVARRHDDGVVYLSLECECDWEPEHGLQIVFKRGRAVNKVGPYDGHLTNSDAFGNPRFEEIVYVGHSLLSSGTRPEPVP